jgi:ABC-type nitrate/sulfonate/bicarbonate transport system permease component
MIVIGLIGLTLDLIVRRLERHDVVSWGTSQR